MSLEQTIDNLQIRNANMVTFVGTSNTMVDTTTGRIQTKGIQHNSNVITDISGPHGRGVATLKKYPEIAFEEGKFEYNNSSNTYTQAGYTVSVSSQDANLTNDERGIVYYMFDGAGAGPYDNQWTSASASNYGAGTFNNTNAHYQIAATDVDGATIPHGEWIKLKMPKKIRLERVFLQPNLSNMNETPEDFKIYGSNDGTTWKLLITQTGMVPRDAGNDIVPATTISGYYDEYAIVITKIYNNAQPDTSIEELEFYGYEEDPPAGDHSVDTTFKSRFNNAQTTGVQVLVDGATGLGTNQISGGPDPSGNQSTYVTDGKYWTLNGTLTSNLSVEANTFLEGDQPHAVSVWFNSSNLEANVSNTCVFSIASEEKLDSVNLDLQSNTWHNLTYAYQGEGGSRVTYLDGRKVSEDQAEDTFGDYPPFAMTGYSQGGYVVSVSSTLTATDYFGWYAFNSDTTTPATGWVSADPVYTGSSYTAADPRNLGTDYGGAATVNGEYIILEMPHRLRVNYAKITHRNTNIDRSPASGRFYGSNDGINWEEIKQFSGITAADYTARPVTIIINSNKSYKKVALVATGIPKQTADWVGIGNLEYYGHRENDLVRLPDPTNVLKYPHIAMTGPAQRGYVASSNNEYTPDGRLAWKAYDGIDTDGSTNIDAWMTQDPSWTTATPGEPTGTGDNAPDTFTVGGVNYTGHWNKLELPHKIRVSQIYMSSRMSTRLPYKGVFLGSDDDSSWEVIYSFNNTLTWSAVSGVGQATTITGITNTNSYKYVMLVVQQINGSDDRLWLNQIKYYGTGVDSIPIQVGGGNIDKVANFRVYDKFIEEDQVNEIWNAQKEEFGRAKPQMVLQQGKLGIGTDAPQGSLSVADEPHGLEEFPPRGMTGYKTYFEGHGEFCVSASNVFNSAYTGYKAFDKNSTGTTGSWWSQSDAGIIPSYSTSSGDFSYFSYNSQYSTNVEGATKMGHWLQIEFPYKINYKYSDIQGPYTSIGRQPRAGYIIGSNDLTGIWTSLHRFTNVTRTHAYESVRYTPPTVSTQTFKYFRLVIEELNGDQYAGIARWDIFGTREQGQSVLHDGQLTLTKNLNVPRIGPSLDMDDTPRRDRLVVEYNTSTNPTFEGAVRDTSGRGNDGIFKGTATYDSYQKDLTFPANSDRIETGSSLDGIILQTTNTVSVWVKCNNPTSWEAICIIGEDTSRKHLGLWVRDATSVAVHSDNSLSGSGGNFEYEVGDMQKWNHITVVRYGTSFEDHHVYVNGAKVSASVSTSKTDGGFDLNKKTHLTLGTSARGLYGSATAQNYHLDGSLSNFKLYDVALTAEEVKTLYDMGRNGSVANPQPLHIAAPLYSPGTIVQVQYASTPFNNTVRQVITGGELSDAANDIDYLDMNFKPKFANSSILLTAMINTNAAHVASFGFKEDGTVIRTQANNTNATGAIATVYEGTTSIDYMVNICIQVLIPANGTHTRRYNAAANSHWSDVDYTLCINDRNNNDMRSISNMVVYEIAN